MTAIKRQYCPPSTFRPSFPNNNNCLRKIQLRDFLTNQRNPVKYKGLIKLIQKQQKKQNRNSLDIAHSRVIQKIKQNREKTSKSKQQIHPEDIQTLEICSKQIKKQHFITQPSSETFVIESEQYKIWQKRMRQKQIIIKFPQIELIKQTLVIQQSSLNRKLSPERQQKLFSIKKRNFTKRENDCKQKCHLLKRKSIREQQNKQFREQKHKANSSITLKQTIQPNDISAWTINKWKQ